MGCGSSSAAKVAQNNTARGALPSSRAKTPPPPSESHGGRSDYEEREEGDEKEEMDGESKVPGPPRYVTVARGFGPRELLISWEPPSVGTVTGYRVEYRIQRSLQLSNNNINSNNNNNYNNSYNNNYNNGNGNGNNEREKRAMSVSSVASSSFSVCTNDSHSIGTWTAAPLQPIGPTRRLTLSVRTVPTSFRVFALNSTGASPSSQPSSFKSTSLASRPMIPSIEISAAHLRKGKSRKEDVAVSDSQAGMCRIVRGRGFDVVSVVSSVGPRACAEMVHARVAVMVANAMEAMEVKGKQGKSGRGSPSFLGDDGSVLNRAAAQRSGRGNGKRGGARVDDVPVILKEVLMACEAEALAWGTDEAANGGPDGADNSAQMSAAAAAGGGGGGIGSNGDGNHGKDGGGNNGSCGNSNNNNNNNNNNNSGNNNNINNGNNNNNSNGNNNNNNSGNNNNNNSGNNNNSNNNGGSNNNNGDSNNNGNAGVNGGGANVGGGGVNNPALKARGGGETVDTDSMISARMGVASSHGTSRMWDDDRSSAAGGGLSGLGSSGAAVTVIVIDRRPPSIFEGGAGAGSNHHLSIKHASSTNSLSSSPHTPHSPHSPVSPPRSGSTGAPGGGGAGGGGAGGGNPHSGQDATSMGDALPRLYTASIGNVQAVLSRSAKEILIAGTHVPSHPGERSRISRAGGTAVAFGKSGRINEGGLTVSRLIGLANHKAAYPKVITADAKLRKVDISNPPDEGVVIAVPGMWSVVRPGEAASLLTGDRTTDAVAMGLCVRARKMGYSGNLSVVAIRFLPVVDTEEEIELEDETRESVTTLGQQTVPSEPEAVPTADL